MTTVTERKQPNKQRKIKMNKYAIRICKENNERFAPRLKATGAGAWTISYETPAGVKIKTRELLHKGRVCGMEWAIA